ncbi:MAG TPA: DNA-formamidopyrimidine glycosylase family protein, partial [Acidimicrobiales bacterium]|nr:DNA-formamidopyrimidine glycosylase family protein [Acidimicrobiales bacterium]
MPEGDTIHRTARTLHAALAGRRVVRFEAPRLRVRPFPDGTVVEGVEARGKHCLVRFDDGRVLHTHMRMTGSWHLYRPGERWRKSPGAARVVLEVAPTGDRDGWVAVCFAAPVVELVDEAAGPVAAHLGPDLCRVDADLDEAARRLGALPAATELGDALLDQRVAAGIGNVYKSEACFAAALDPFT